MTMEQQQDIAPDVEDVADTPEATEAAADAPQEADEAPEPSGPEVEARKYGWAPKDEWRGDPDKWKDADAFLELAQNNVPMLRSKVDKQAAELERQQREFQQRVDRLERVTRAALERQKAEYESRVAALSKREERAVEMGDLDEWKAVKAERERLGDAPEVPEAPKQAPQLPPEYTSTVAAFKAQNPWYETDPDMTAAAVAFSNANGARKPSLTLAENLAETAAMMRRMFPDRFKAQGVSRTAGDGAPPPAKQSLASRLPPEARREGERYVKDGLFKNVEEYAKEYFA